MYKLHLILKYLRKRRIAWVSLIAVMLCTAMVLVVISVMGGWLRMFRESFHAMSGDIIISRQSLAGFEHYEQMIREVEQLPEVAGAAPVLKTFGLINIAGQIQEGVQVIAFDLEQMDRINQFRRTLYRQYERPMELAQASSLPAEERAAYRELAREPASFELPLHPDVYRSFADPDAEVEFDEASRPGMIVGVGLVFRKRADGTYPDPEQYGLYHAPVTLTVLGVTDSATRVDLSRQTSVNRYWIVDHSRANIWQYDSGTVYVPFDVLQRDLRMQQRTLTDPDTGEQRIVPGRTSEVQIAIKPGVDLYAAKEKVIDVVRRIAHEHGIPFAPDEVGRERPSLGALDVRTWEEANAKFIAAIEKEKILVTMLFGIISVVAIFLIFCIFFMIVVEKTKDIGIIKSVGATSSGVAGIFLGYGLAIGIVGGGLGLLVGFLIVRNINYLHDQMGRLMGVQMWDAETYMFDTIPNTMNPNEVVVIVSVAIISSLLGALVPAIRAARMNPVEALRWE
jgi:lipoprotein-releasing system permease protein